jgi:polar amino acid transport system substrate-binding protein
MKTLTAILSAILLACLSCVAMADPPVAATTKANAAVVQRAKRHGPVNGMPTLAQIRKTGVLRVGVALNAPWVMHDKQGKLIGYSVDVARQFADDMGWKLELVPTSWPGLLRELRTNQSDIVISGLSITPQRALLVRFSQPYGTYDIGMVVNRSRFAKDDTAAFTAGAKGRPVAVLKGTIDARVAARALPGAQLVEVENEQAAIDGLRGGRFDAYVAEAPRPMILAKLFPKELRELTGEPLSRTAHGMAVRRGETGLLDVANAWITSAQASGWLKDRQKYWFGGTDWVSEL